MSDDNKRFLVVVGEYSEGSADDIRSTLLDGWGFPSSVEKNPDLLKVIELADVDGSIAKQLQRSMELNARMKVRLKKVTDVLAGINDSKGDSRSEIDEAIRRILAAQCAIEAILKDEEPTWPAA